MSTKTFYSQADNFHFHWKTFLFIRKTFFNKLLPHLMLDLKKLHAVELHQPKKYVKVKEIPFHRKATKGFSSERSLSQGFSLSNIL